MGDAVPVEYLLLLLRSDAVVLVEEVKEWTLGLLERGIGARFEVSQIREDALFEFLRVFDRAAEGLESKRQASHNVSAGDVEEVVPSSTSQLPVNDMGGQRYNLPQDTRYIFASWQQESANVLLC